MSWSVAAISYITLIVLSLKFNKRRSYLERSIHNVIFYFPLAFFLVFYLTACLFMYLLNQFVTSRLFFHPLKIEDCPVGEENRISTILSPLDKLLQTEEHDTSINADGLIKLKGKFSIESFKSALINDFAFAKDTNGRLLYPKLTQVVRQRALFSTWEYFPNFNIDNHVTERWMNLSADGELQSFLNAMHCSRMAHELPGFQFFVIHDTNTRESTDETETYIVYRLSHLMGDGLTFVRIFMNSLGKPITKEDQSKLTEMFKKYSKSQYELSVGKLLILAVLCPIYFANMFQLELKNFYKRPTTGKKFSSFTPDLDFKKVKAIKSKTKTCVNDVFLMLLSQALQAYMLEMGEDPANFVWTSVCQGVSLNVSLAGSMSNNFIGIRVLIPLHILDWRKQLLAINSRLNALKYSLEPLFITMVVTSTSYLPDWYRVRSQNYLLDKLVTGLISNIPGPDIGMSIAGTPIEDYVIFIPHVSSATFSTGFLTIGSKLSVCVMTDETISSEPAILKNHLIRRLDEIYKEVV